MSKTIALIGAGYTLQNFKKCYSEYSYIETHRASLEATEDAVHGDLAFLEQCDALIFSLPPSPAALNLIKHIEFNRKAILLSSIGVYARHDGSVDESTQVGDSERAKLIAQIETEFLTLAQPIVLRLGGLFDESRHPINSIIKKSLPVQGKALINFVHIKDVCEALRCILETSPLQQVYNLVDMNHPTKGAYYSSLTNETLNITDSGLQNYQVSSERFLTEFKTSPNFLNRITIKGSNYEPA